MALPPYLIEASIIVRWPINAYDEQSPPNQGRLVEFCTLSKFTISGHRMREPLDVAVLDRVSYRRLAS